MSPTPKPKVLLFDMGGVCVNSPLQAILDYELSHSIPQGWINASISHSKPSGFWQRLETGSTPLSPAWFAGFHKDLHNASFWHTFCARKNIDPVPPLPKIDVEELFWDMIAYSRDPDPWMFPALQKLHSTEEFMLVALSNTLPIPEDMYPPSWDPTQSWHHKSSLLRSLFDVFIASDAIGLRKPSPEIYTYTLSTINAFRSQNSHTARGKKLGWDKDVKAEEVLFLDDIGENLKGGKNAGFRTIKVNLGRTYEAVDELEAATGLKLAGEHPRVPVQAGQTRKSRL